MIQTEQRYALEKDNLVVTATPFPGGIDIKAFAQQGQSGETIVSPFARPAAHALARLAGGNIKILFGDHPNKDRSHAPSRAATRAVTYFAATLGNVTDGESTFVSPGIVALETDTAARPHLEELGFPFSESSFKLEDGHSETPAVQIAQLHDDLSGSFPAEFSGATPVQPPQPR
ncbi:MAG TPA: hypothetical protein VLF62_00850 [Candidatus Saccharimonadales bacterium]|nr:hypothetical protein [Candidatus Saccharimonadales bacterium]